MEFPDTRRLPYEGTQQADIYVLRNLRVHIHPAERLGLVGLLRDALPADGALLVRTAHDREVARPRR